MDVEVHIFDKVCYTYGHYLLSRCLTNCIRTIILAVVCTCHSTARDLLILIFEGSTTVHPYDDESLPAIELGASIFVKANRNLFRASEEFGLKLRSLDEEDDDMGIWDGEKILLVVGAPYSTM